MDSEKDDSFSTASLMSTSCSDSDTDTSATDSLSYSLMGDGLIIYGEIINCCRNSNQVPINKLSSETHNFWTIKAKVLFKSDVLTWNKAESKGRYFFMHLTDGTETIKAVAFNEVCDLFFPAIDMNKEYLVSRCTIRTANAAYKNGLSHNYELFLKRNTLFSPYFETSLSRETEQITIKTSTLLDLALEIKGKLHTQIFHVEATILTMKKNIDEVVYKACPSGYCKKKVIPINDVNNSYYCPKCDDNFPDYVHRFMLKAKIADWTGRLWITMFDEAAEPFLGISAYDIVKKHETNYVEYESFFKRSYESHTFVLAADMKIYDDENRVCGVGSSFYEIDYKQSCRKLIKDVKRLQRPRKTLTK